MTDSERDSYRYARDALAKERDHRREKLWSLFTWTSTLLTALIGGVVALSAEQDFKLVPAHRWLLTCAVCIISAYSCRWLKANLDLEDGADVSIRSLDEKLGVPKVSTDWPPLLGYIPTLGLLFVAALFTIWAVPE